MNNNFSKPIKKADDESKLLIIETLSGANTYGFDVDSIYYFETENLWVVIEFLKCDAKRVKPSTSHPSRYWKKNWRKFASLWRLVKKLGAEFYLVNYETQDHANSQDRQEREFYVIKVLDMDPSENGGITREEQSKLTFAEFKAWFQTLNARGKHGTS